MKKLIFMSLLFLTASIASADTWEEMAKTYYEDTYSYDNVEWIPTDVMGLDDELGVQAGRYAAFSGGMTKADKDRYAELITEVTDLSTILNNYYGSGYDFGLDAVAAFDDAETAYEDAAMSCDPDAYYQTSIDYYLAAMTFWEAVEMYGLAADEETSYLAWDAIAEMQALLDGYDPCK